MQFALSRDALLKPLQLVAGVVERRQTLPVSSNVLLVLADGQLSLTGTDLEVELVGRVAVDDEVQGGEITVPVGQGTLRASGDLKLVSGLPLRAKAELEQVSMFQVFDRVGMGWAWVDLLATGPVSLSGKLSPAPELQGQADLKIARFVTWGHPVGQKLPGPPIVAIPSGEVALDLGIHPDRVELLNGRVKVGGSRAVANVVIPYGGRGPITIETTAEPRGRVSVSGVSARSRAHSSRENVR